jgi:serine/threonine protein phosphatase PrpC
MMNSGALSLIPMPLSAPAHSLPSQATDETHFQHGQTEYHHTGPWHVIRFVATGVRHQEAQKVCEDAEAFSDVSTTGYINIAVADGVGSGARGDICSRAAANHAVKLRITPIEETSSPIGLQEIVNCIDGAEEVVVTALREHSSEPGATMLTAAWLDQHGRGHLTHVGDARAYLISQDQSCLLTQDHTYRNTRETPGPGQSADDPSRMIGIYTGQADVQDVALKHGDALLLCSDGLYGYMPEPDFLNLLIGQLHGFQAEPTDLRARALAQHLFKATLNAGSDDDISFSLAVYLPPSSRPPI